MPITRVNSVTIGASGTTAAAYNTTVGVACLAGDLLIVTANCNGTHATNGMSFREATNDQAFTTISETDQGGASSRWQQTFFLVTALNLASGVLLELSPYALNTASSFVVDVFRGASGTISRAVQIQSGAVALTANTPALLSAPAAGDLVLSMITVSSGTDTQPSPYLKGSDRTTGPTCAIGYVLAADGVSTYGGTWTWGTSNSSALQTVAFAAAPAAAPVVGGVSTAYHPGRTPARGAQFRFDVANRLSYNVVATAGPVTFDAAASQSGLGVSTINWLHTCTGANGVLLVDVAVGVTSAPDSATTSVTYNGVAMTSLGKVHANNSNVGYVERFALVAPATGSNSVVVTTSGSVTSLVGGSMSFAGANQTLASYTTTTNFGSGTAATVTAVAPPVGSFVMGGHGAGNTWGAVGNTSRYNVTNSTSTGCGNLAGNTAAGAGSNIAMTATVSATDFWASQATIIPAATGGGSNNFTQALSAAVGFTTSDAFRTSKLVGAAASFTSTQTRAVTRGLAATVAFTGAVTRQLLRNVSAALSFTGALSTAAVHHFTQALSATLSFTSAQVLRTAHGTAATLGFTSALTRAVRRALTAGVTFTSSAARAVRTGLAATVSFTGALGSAAVHHFTQTLSATVSFTSAQTLRTGRTIAATAGFTSSQVRFVARGLIAATVGFTSGQVRSVRTNLAAAVSFAGAVTRRTAKTVAGATVSFAGAVSSAAVHHFTQALNATVGFTGSLTTAAVHFFTQALTASVSFTSAQTRRLGKGLAATLGFTGATTLRTSRGLAGGIGFTSADALRTSTHLAGSVSLTSAQTRRTAKTVGAAGASFTGSLVSAAAHFFTKSLTATVSFTGSLTTSRTFGRVLTATVGFTGAQTRRAGHLVAASVAFTGTQVRFVRSHLAAALGSSGALGLVPTLLSALTNLRIRLAGRRGVNLASGKEPPGAASGREGPTTLSGKEDGT